MQYRVYGTGDQVWTAQRYGKDTVVKVVTHDGLVWSEEAPTLTRMSGMELAIHKVTVFCQRLILKVLA